MRPSPSPQIASLPLGEGEISVWFAALDELAWGAGEIESFLSIEERERAKRYVFEADGRRFAVGRAVLRIILGHHISLRPAEITFRYNTHGKPVLDDYELSFNMSRCAGRAVYALTCGRSIGVDIERERDITQMDQLAKRIFSEYEYERFYALPLNIRRNHFFTSWTRKEALVKAMGEGLSAPLHMFDVSASSNGSPDKIRVIDDSQRDRRWAICDVGQDEGYRVAVAAEWPCSFPPRINIFPLNGHYSFPASALTPSIGQALCQVPVQQTTFPG